jgi:hypothetical protein
MFVFSFYQLLKRILTFLGLEMKLADLIAVILLNGLGLALSGTTSTKESSLREMRKLLLTKDNILEHLTRQQKKLQGSILNFVFKKL